MSRLPVGSQPRPPRRIGLLGCGAIGEVVARALSRPRSSENTDAAVDGAELAAILVRDAAKHEPKRSWLPAGVLLTSDPEEFLSCALDVVVEAAGQPSVREYGERCLHGGCDFIVTSTGAFTDDALYAAMRAAAAAQESGRLHLASGAMPGLDWLQAATLSSSSSSAVVRVTQMKPPASWAACGHAPTEAAVAAVGGTGLDPEAWAAHGPLTLFEGPARAAAQQYPKSSNVTATLALATVGLDRTQVTLVADPRPQFHTEVRLEPLDGVGSIKVEVSHEPSATNPRTSADVALSVLRSLRATCSPCYVDCGPVVLGIKVQHLNTGTRSNNSTAALRRALTSFPDDSAGLLPLLNGEG